MPTTWFPQRRVSCRPEPLRRQTPSLIPGTSRRLCATELRLALRRPLTRKRGAVTAAPNTISSKTNPSAGRRMSLDGRLYEGGTHEK